MSSAAYLPRKPTDLTQKEGQDEDEDDDGDGQPRVPYGIADLLWYSMKKKLSRAIPGLPKFKRKQAEQRTKGDSGGKIVWVMGAGETSFMGTGSISGAMDAARESVALSLSNTQTRRARLLARISTLWAIDDKSCFWIVKQAVEAQ
ncbi:hypothetical protein FRB98_007905 [Tulasnella sp. 332]|nr:hypothetical protein FRB98_007905 [Tulasnella sp. 332]